jgi:ribulose-phosphate 3-epimerase
MVEILPAIFTSDPVAFAEQLPRMADVFERVHLDFADGKFVLASLLPTDILRTVQTSAKIECHFMVQRPAFCVEAALTYSIVDTVIVHVEAECDVQDLLEAAHRVGKRFCLAINPDTSLSRLDPYIAHVDQVLCMTVHPGAMAQPFLSDVLERIGTLHQKYPSLRIEADGGINPQTIEMVVHAGASRVAVGSYMTQATSLTGGLEQLERPLRNL